jgi:hypothetical protein
MLAWIWAALKCQLHSKNYMVLKWKHILCIYIVFLLFNFISHSSQCKELDLTTTNTYLTITELFNTLSSSPLRVMMSVEERCTFTGSRKSGHLFKEPLICHILILKASILRKGKCGLYSGNYGNLTQLNIICGLWVGVESFSKTYLPTQ